VLSPDRWRKCVPRADGPHSRSESFAVDVAVHWPAALAGSRPETDRIGARGR